MDISIEKGAEI